MRAWREIRASRRDVVTTNLVVIESHALIARRGGVEAGLRFWDAFVAQGHRLVWVDEELTRDAVERWVRRYQDKVLSLTDAVSFEVMRREGLRDAFAFDEDFVRVGFRLVG